MLFLSYARRKGFWLLDKLKGGDIACAYNRIKEIDQLDSSNSIIRNNQEQALAILLNRACNETAFYKKYVNLSFKQFPIINKNTIRTNQEAFISNKYKINELIQMSTSGSTGTPFICYQNSEKKKQVNAEIIYYSEKVGYKLGENLSYIRTIVKQNKKSSLKQFFQNQTLINCMSLDDEGINSMIQALVKKSQHERLTLLGYGSTYTGIKDYALRNGIKEFKGIRVNGIISGSDMLFDDTRASIMQLFGNVPMVSRYSNEENGVIGQDEGINNVFSINEANYIVEICDDNGNSVEDGKLGHIVVTDLYNYSMPMIRYDTGDIGAIKAFDINGRTKRCICDFSGRSVDVIFNTKGSILSPHVITNYMWSYPDINQYQIIQKGTHDYTVKLNVPQSFTKDNELKKLLLKLLGDDAEITIEKYDEIPVIASGKRRYIVNEMNQR